MSNITITNRQAVLDLINAADESAELQGLVDLQNFISVDTPTSVATFSASSLISVQTILGGDMGQMQTSPGAINLLSNSTDDTISSTIQVYQTDIFMQSTDETKVARVTLNADGSTNIRSDDGDTLSTIEVALAGITFGSNDATNQIILTIGPNQFNIQGLQTFANDAAAGAGGLVAGDLYKHSAGNHTSLYIKA